MVDIKKSAAPTVSTGVLAASVQVVQLPVGLYLFSVKAAQPAARTMGVDLQLPAVQVSLGPGASSRQVEFIPGPGSDGNWLFRPGNLLVVKVMSDSAALVVTSVRSVKGDTLEIVMSRLGDEAVAVPSPATAPLVATSTASEAPTDPARPRLQVGLHLRGQGDVNFPEPDWAGRVGAGSWIEAFSIMPQEFVLPQDIEYKGLTASGYETPWISGGAACGTRGMGVPLVGFAVRLRGRAAAVYDCEYSGYFQSGATVGAVRNGAPCRSTTSGDPLEGIQFRFVLRRPASAASSTTAATSSPALAATPAPPSTTAVHDVAKLPSALAASKPPAATVATQIIETVPVAPVPAAAVPESSAPATKEIPAKVAKAPPPPPVPPAPKTAKRKS